MSHTEDSTVAPPRRKEIYTYAADWTIYAMHWSTRPDNKFRIALGSFLEDFQNKGLYLLQIFTSLLSFSHIN